MSHRRALTFPSVLLMMSILAGADCTHQTKSPPAATPPTAVPATQAAPASQPVATQPVATQPAMPESTYDSKPPYPVKLYVRSPDDKQPGWLKILTLADESRIATVDGSFPRQNRIYVDTDNVQLLRIHIDHLPLAPRKRIVLQIDDQGIELARKKREFVILTRTPAGIWNVVKSEE
jgi:hypothetical protein